MDIIKTSSKGQIVIPEKVRERFNIEEGTRLVLIERGNKLILEKEDDVKNYLNKKMDEEDKDWQKLSQASFKEVWDNKKDAKTWSKYL